MRKCLCCSVETRNQKFCSRSCAAKVNNRTSPKRGTGPRTSQCKYCGNDVVSGGKYTRVFCNMACANGYRAKERVDAWWSGTHDGLNATGTATAKWVRQALIERFGEQCSECGWNETHPTTGRVPIELDHIDGNWLNALPENVRLLCPNHHALTPTYRWLNSAKARQLRGEESLASMRPRVNSPGCRDFPRASVSVPASTR